MSPLLILATLWLAPYRPDSTLWLDSLDLSGIEQDWSAPNARNSVEGTPLTIARTKYEHGYGTHANSSFQIDLKGNAASFSAEVGVDDEVGTKGNVRFEVIVDGKKRAETPVMHGGEVAQHLEVSLKGAHRLQLLAEAGLDTIDYDHADWGDARLVLVNPRGPKPSPMTVSSEPTMKIYSGSSSTPEINGARVVGCTPGRPILYKIAASGEGPLTYSASGLPAGLSLDPSSGVLSGTVQEPGTYHCRVVVTGARGRDSRDLTLVFGDHQLALTPPMGWNSWNVWGTTVTADKVRAAADSFGNTGLGNFGYRYVNIDDAWEGDRDANGEIQTNAKFGDMAALASYVHSKGFGLGIYSSPGRKTCAGYEASYKHEQQDANTYAKWGIDYLKYDWCSYGSIAPNPTLDQLKAPYQVMRAALDGSGRDIVFSLCQYGMGDVYKWGKSVGGNLWRTTGDITDTYSSMATIAFAHSEKAVGVSPGGWNDPDMLCVGKLGWGDHPRPTRLKPNEQITHITMWSLLAAPLILGCDLTQLDPWTKSLITNHDVIDVDQDPLGKAATRVYSTTDGVEVWSRPLWDGTIAVGLMNRGRSARPISVSWSRLGLAGNLPVRDLWERRNIGYRSDKIHATVPGHGAKLFRIGRMKH